MSTALYPLPAIGSVGTYTLLAPFNSIVLPDDEYTCTAIRNISDYISNSDDAYTLVYLDNGLTQTDYQNDLAANMPIVSLQSSVGHWMFIPARFIVTFPITNGVPYCNKILGVNIGAFPANADLTFLITAISNVVVDNIGITPEIKEVVTSKTVNIPISEDATIQTARKSRIAASLTDTGKLQNMTNNYNDALTKIAALEAYILANKTVLGI